MIKQQGMIDWLTIQFSLFGISSELIEILKTQTGSVLSYDSDGTIDFTIDKSLEIDSGSTIHHISIRANSVQYSGNPALLKNANNAFGSNCIIESFNAVVDFINTECSKLTLDKQHKSLVYTDEKYRKLHRCTRIDFNKNVKLKSIAEVATALTYLTMTNRRGYDCSSVTKNNVTSVYWNKGGSHLEGKAYDKFSQVTHVIMKKFNTKKQRAVDGSNGIVKFDDEMLRKLPPYTSEELNLLNGVLRLELKIGRKYIDKFCAISYKNRHDKDFAENADNSSTIFGKNVDKKRYWYDYTPSLLNELFNEYFKPILKTCKVQSMTQLLKELALNSSEKQANAAYGTWCRIKTDGYKATKLAMKDNTFYRHKRLLLKSGLNSMSFQAGKFVNLKTNFVQIDLSNVVTSFDDLRKCA